jgi:hypothetical protein
VLERATAFYQLQLHRYPEATRYLEQRGLRDPALIEELGIGYAPGGDLRSHLAAQGYSFESLLDTGLISPQGRDTFCRRMIFPCRQQEQSGLLRWSGESIFRCFGSPECREYSGRPKPARLRRRRPDGPHVA